MSDVKIVHGYIKNGWFQPAFVGDNYRYDLLKSKAGVAFIDKHRIDINHKFSGFCYAFIGTKGREKLMSFERGSMNYNFIISGAGDAKATLEHVLKEKGTIANKVKSLNYHAVLFTLMSGTNSIVDGDIRYELFASDYKIAEDIVQAINSIGIKAYVTDEKWQAVSGVANEDPFVKGAVKTPEPVVEERDPNYFVLETDVNVAFKAAISVMEQRGFASVLLTGPSGFGKTTAAIRLAKHLGYTFTKVDCGTLQDPTEIATIRGFKGGETVFERTEFINVFENGNAVILLDEANRMYPNVSNALMPVLDGTGQLTIDTEKFVRGKNIIFIATVNMGQQYVGTFQMDTAFLNRFGISAKVGNLQLQDEINIVFNHSSLSRADAGAVVSLLRELRKTLPTSNLDFSPRTAENVALALNSGIGMHWAFRTVLAAICEDQEWKVIIDILNSNGHKMNRVDKPLF